MDGGSYVNVVNERLVKKLALTTIWLREKGYLLVDKQAMVTFSLGAYEDRVVKVFHDGVINCFTFLYSRHRVMLKPLSPREVQEDQQKMKTKGESERKAKRKMKKKKVIVKPKGERKREKIVREKSKSVKRK
ncbi:hypothetical protein CR513_45771, partial [Mucuna pruriens]